MKITEFTYFFPDRARLLRADQPLFDQLATHPDWIAQKKYNGSRLQLHYYQGEFQFWNRHGQKMAYKPSKEVLEALHALELHDYWLFDGELRHNKVIGIRHKIVLWDVFIAGNELLNKVPYGSRFTILLSKFGHEAFNLDWFDTEHVVSPVQVFKNSEGLYDAHVVTTCDFKTLFNSLDDKEIEGLVLKNRTGCLLLGRTKAQESPWTFKVRKK